MQLLNLQVKRIVKRDCKYGDRGDSVMLLQSHLLSLGFICDIDGIFGKETLRALNEYQTSKNIQPTNGINLEDIDIDYSYLLLDRKEYKDTYTMGSLYLDDEFICNTLEDKYRDLTKEAKIPGSTCIPSGVYDVVITWSPRFKDMYPRLLNVPFFSGILIHKGNTHRDTEGCILVGTKNGDKLIGSKVAYDKLYNRLLKCQAIKIIIQ